MVLKPQWSELRLMIGREEWIRTMRFLHRRYEFKEGIRVCVLVGVKVHLSVCVCLRVCVGACAAVVNGQLSINSRARGFCCLSGLLLLNSFS